LFKTRRVAAGGLQPVLWIFLTFAQARNSRCVSVMEISLLSVLDYAGVATFAASGALMAAQKRQDVVTFIFFAAITGVG
jgi:hypothetical protein